MKYINTVTGRIYEAESELGGSWVPYEEPKATKKAEAEKVENEKPDLEKMKLADLREILDKNEIEYDAKATKADLIKIIQDSEE